MSSVSTKTEPHSPGNVEAQKGNSSPDSSANTDKLPLRRKPNRDEEEDIFSLGSRESRKKRKKKKSHRSSGGIGYGGDIMNMTSRKLASPKLELKLEPKAHKEPEAHSSLDIQEEEIIVLTDEDDEEPSITIPRESGGRTLRSITKRNPTRISKPESSSARRIRNNRSGTDDTIDLDEPTELGEEDAYFNDIMKSIRGIQTNRKAVDNYEFSDKNEVDRPYLVDVLPKVHTDRPTRFTTKGTKIFGGILMVIVQHYKKLGLFPKHAAAANFALFWIQGRREIKSFFKPSTLRILPPPEHEKVQLGDVKYTRIHCLLVPKESASHALDTFEELKPRSAALLSASDFDYLEGIEEIENKEDEFDEKLKEELDEYIKKERLASLNLVAGEEIIDLDDDEEEYFTIGLKGKDNKRVEVKVSPSTKIQKILEYYLAQLNIEPSSVDFSKAKLLFDDEPLDLHDVVGSTELEEDFEIQIYL